MNEFHPVNSLPDDALIRLDEVLKRIPVSKSTYYEGQKRGLYPSSIRIGPRSSAYRLSAIKAWVADPEGWQRANQRPTS